MEQILEFSIHHWPLVLALIAILALIIYTETSSQVSGIRLLSTQELTQLINHENAVVVDVRQEADFNLGHIINSVTVPADDLESRLGKLQKYKSKTIVIVCQTGQQAPRIGAQLRKVGFEKVFALKGGVQAWKGESLPLVS